MVGKSINLIQITASIIKNNEELNDFWMNHLAQVEERSLAKIHAMHKYGACEIQLLQLNPEVSLSLLQQQPRPYFSILHFIICVV